MTLREMREVLAAEGIRLTRSLGQNFLHDGNQLRRIVALADLPPGAAVLEIGPGLGPLTEELLRAGARVLAVEKDHRLVPILRRRLGDQPLFELIEADAVEWLREQPRDWSGTHLVANLPYSVGSVILVDLALMPNPPASMTVTLQAEVVDRIKAHAGTGEFGVLTLLLARSFEVAGGFRIPASCFFPPPDVTSAVVRLRRRAEPLVPRALGDLYVRVVKRAFSQRRKRLRKVLREEWSDEALGWVWGRQGWSEDVRAEALKPEDFAVLTVGLAAYAESAVGGS